MRLTGKLAQVELKKSKDDVTGKMGLSWMVHCMEHFGFKEMVKGIFGEKKKSNREIKVYEKMMGGAMTRIAGGDRVSDIDVLGVDQGLKNSLGWDRIIGSDAYGNFNNDRRSNGKKRLVNEEMVIKGMRKSDEDEFTYDNDATYFDSDKQSATYSYKGTKQFSGLIGCIAELGVINTVDHRRGHVSPRKGILNQLRKTVSQAKRAGKRIGKFRSDSAGHANKIFKFCKEKGIEFYVSLVKNEAVNVCIRGIRECEWKPLAEKYAKRLGTEWAESVYVTEEGVSMRMMVLRWANPIDEQTLFDQEPLCYHVISTNNNEIEPMKWLEIHNGRMGSIENINKEIKNELGCDYSPSHEYEKNRGYFLMGIIAYNMVQIMKLFYLGEEAMNWAVKRIRYRFINVCGKIVKTGRRFYCKIINVTDQSYELFRNCKSKLIINGY